MAVLTGWQGLPQLLCLVTIGHAEGVKVLGAADLELGQARDLLDLNGLGVLATCCREQSNVMFEMGF
jgi:hypothetical protein